MPAATTAFPGHTAQDIAVSTWALTSADPTGDPVRLGDHADRTVQVLGTFGGASVVWEGSLEGTTFRTLTNLLGNPLSYTGPGLDSVAEMVVYVRPRLVGGAGAAVTAVLAGRRSGR